MLNSIFTMIDRSVGGVTDWWSSTSSTYRGAGCLLLALFLMWQATKSSEQHDRRFFLTGMAALGLLAYGAIVFINGHAE